MVSVLFVVVGVIHLLPVMGLDASRLEGMYGVTGLTADEVVLMRHRAVVFGVLGGACLYAAVVDAVQGLVWTMMFGTVVAFLGLARGSVALRKVVIADVVALAALLGIAGVWVA